MLSDQKLARRVRAELRMTQLMLLGWAYTADSSRQWRRPTVMADPVPSHLGWDLGILSDRGTMFGKNTREVVKYEKRIGRL